MNNSTTMTNYEYAGEMQELCFKVSQAHKAMGQTGLFEFYLATSEGYAKLREGYSVEEAGAKVTSDQMEMLENSIAYVKDLQKQAADKIGQEIGA